MLSYLMSFDKPDVYNICSKLDELVEPSMAKVLPEVFIERKVYLLLVEMCTNNTYVVWSIRGDYLCTIKANTNGCLTILLKKRIRSHLKMLASVFITLGGLVFLAFHITGYLLLALLILEAIAAYNIYRYINHCDAKETVEWLRNCLGGTLAII